jgi:hypothetical protein
MWRVKPRLGDPHIVLQLRRVLLHRVLLGEVPRQHEFCLKHPAVGVDDAIEGRRHPCVNGMDEPSLDIFDQVAGVVLIPPSIEVLGRNAKLDDQGAGQVVRLGLAALFPPQPHQCSLVIAHDDAGVRAPDKGPPFVV